MASPSTAATPRPLHRQLATVTPLPSALCTPVENIRVRGNYPAGVVSLVRVRRHLRAIELRALMDRPMLPQPAQSRIEKAQYELGYWHVTRDFACRMLSVSRRELAAACHGTEQELNSRLQTVGVLQLVPKACSQTQSADALASPASAALADHAAGI